MANKYLLPDNASLLLQNKLNKLTTKLQSSINSPDFKTQESILFESIKALDAFYLSMSDPQLIVKNIDADYLPNVDVYNNLWNQLLNDLITVFSTLEAVEALTVSNFNFVTTESNRLTARIKAVSSKLGDYILYSVDPTKDAFFFTDSFNDLSKIDFNSPLLNAEQGNISEVEGIISLPIDLNKNSFITVRETPTVNPNSNGTVGNNQETGSPYNGDLNTLLDDNPDTWFEYERVTTEAADTNEPLKLDLTLNIGDATIVNNIVINPNNFGTKTVIHIDSIETSLDGQVYTSIKDDIPISGFTTEDEENVFNLAPSTSKYAGQGVYTFTPRKVKYVHVVLRQTEPYIISTSTGDKLRYAIGLRDINIRGYVYKSNGELVSKPYETQDEIRKVAIDANQNPTEPSELAAALYYVSPDNGATWHKIQLKSIGGTTGQDGTPEVLEFNGVSAQSILTAAPVKSLRVKIALSREDENFTAGSSSMYQQRLTKAELHSVPSSSPFSMDLEEPPIDGTVVVVDPLFGSRGISRSPYILGHTTDKLDQRKYRLPFTNYPRPVKKVLRNGKYHVEIEDAANWQNVEVGGTPWAQASGVLDIYGVDDKVYAFDPNTGIIEFGDGTNGQAPEENEPIATWFEPERLYPSELPAGHIAKLEFSTSANKDDMTVKRYDEIADATTVVPKKATVVRLGQKNITDLGNMADVFTGTKRTFLNGKDELITSNEWSIDMIEGIVYLYDPTDETIQQSINFKYQPIYTLTNDEWDWANTDLLRDSVAISDDAWQTISVLEEEVLMVSDATVLDVEHLSGIDGTFKFTTTVSGVDLPDTEDPFLKEVVFQDGIVELGSAKLQTTEQIAAHGGTGVEDFDFTEEVTSDTDFAVLFSNTDYFVTSKTWGACVSDGDYAVKRSTNEYQVHWDTAISNPGTVSYYYDNPNFSANGLYSIDYKLGKIYTQVSMHNLWVCKINYDYIDLRAEYRIARMLNPVSYDVDITNQTITIKDSEVLKRMMTPHGETASGIPYYLVNYDYVASTREDVSSLRDFFSPVVKDYALKVLLKGKIF